MRAFLSAVLLLVATSCTSMDRAIESPTGPIQGVKAGPYVVLGVGNKTTSLHAGDAKSLLEETVDIQAPVGTEVIVPAITEWSLGYGSTDPQDMSGVPTGQKVTWHSEDHNFGYGHAKVEVTDIDAAAPGATFQSAKVRVIIMLSDDNSDDSMFGVVGYHLIFLGKQPVTP